MPSPSGFKKDKIIASVTLPGFAINAMMADYLKQLTRVGLYGSDITQVARTLLYEAIRDKVESGKLKPLEFSEDYMHVKGEPNQDEESGS